jgi:hypothetical protein
MSRRLAVAIAVTALSGAGCSAVSSMTQHWFYGTVTSVGSDELCLSNGRSEEPEAQRCFTTDGASRDVEQGDLVRVQYERDGSGHGGGTVVQVLVVRRGQSDG